MKSIRPISTTTILTLLCSSLSFTLSSASERYEIYASKPDGASYFDDGFIPQFDFSEFFTKVNAAPTANNNHNNNQDVGFKQPRSYDPFSSRQESIPLNSDSYFLEGDDEDEDVYQDPFRPKVVQVRSPPKFEIPDNFVKNGFSGNPFGGGDPHPQSRPEVSEPEPPSSFPVNLGTTASFGGFPARRENSGPPAFKLPRQNGEDNFKAGFVDFDAPFGGGQDFASFLDRQGHGVFGSKLDRRQSKPFTAHRPAIIKADDIEEPQQVDRYQQQYQAPLQQEQYRPPITYQSPPSTQYDQSALIDGKNGYGVGYRDPDVLYEYDSTRYERQKLSNAAKLPEEPKVNVAEELGHSGDFISGKFRRPYFQRQDKEEETAVRPIQRLNSLRRDPEYEFEENLTPSGLSQFGKDFPAYQGLSNTAAGISYTGPSAGEKEYDIDYDERNNYGDEGREDDYKYQQQQPHYPPQKPQKGFRPVIGDQKVKNFLNKLPQPQTTRATFTQQDAQRRPPPPQIIKQSNNKALKAKKPFKDHKPKPYKKTIPTFNTKPQFKPTASPVYYKDIDPPFTSTPKYVEGLRTKTTPPPTYAPPTTSKRVKQPFPLEEYPLPSREQYETRRPQKVKQTDRVHVRPPKPPQQKFRPQQPERPKRQKPFHITLPKIQFRKFAPPRSTSGSNVVRSVVKMIQEKQDSLRKQKKPSIGQTAAVIMPYLTAAIIPTIGALSAV